MEQVASLVRTAGLQAKTKDADLPTDTDSRKHGDLLVPGGLFGNASLVLDVTITHPFVGDAADPDKWGKHQPGVLKARTSAKANKHWYHASQSITFIPFVVTTHGLLNPEAIRMVHLLAEVITTMVFAQRGWEQFCPQTFAAHCARHYTRFRGQILMAAFKGAATRLQAGCPWREPRGWDRCAAEDPLLDLPTLLRPGADRALEG